MLSNWCDATTTTTGTGTLTLSAVSGRPLPSAIHATNELVQYSINTSDGKFESGIGTIGATNTLARTKVLSTYDGTTYNNTTATALSLAAGTHKVFITPISEMSLMGMPIPLSGPTNPMVMGTNISATQANIAINAQRAIAFPFRLETCGVITAMAANVSVAVASSTFLLALYEMLSSNGQPGRQVAKTSATLSSATTGFKSQSVAANARVTPGWYWAAVCQTTSTGGVSLTGGAQTGHAFGCDTTPISNVRCDTSGQTDLPDPFPTASPVFSMGNGANAAYIGLILS